MHFLNDMIKSAREKTIEWHCYEITLSQNGLEDGYFAKGHGTIKSDHNGELSLSFICMEESFRIKPRTFVPKDSLDDSQTVTMNAKKIGGDEITSKGLRIEGNVYTYTHQGPIVFKIKLNSIKTSKKIRQACSGISLMRLEFKDKPTIPTNIINSTKSTLGISSAAWNETKLTNLNYEIRIITHDGYSEIIIKGPTSNIQNIRKSVIFYINFSTGLYLQPYFECIEEAGTSTATFYNTDKSKINVTIPAPLSGTIADSDYNIHYSLFNNIYDILEKEPEIFGSVSSQWHRIWHSFSSQELSVPMLTISVAVEGILTDVFIPIISTKLMDESFEEEKERITSLITELPSLSKENISNINRSIKSWGKITPKKALIHLAEKGVIENYHSKNWVTLRNSSAHPKRQEINDARQRKNLNRTFICLGLFYRLALNIFSYDGPMLAYENSTENKLIIQKHTNIIKIQ